MNIDDVLKKRPATINTCVAHDGRRTIWKAHCSVCGLSEINFRTRSAAKEAGFVHLEQEHKRA